MRFFGKKEHWYWARISWWKYVFLWLGGYLVDIEWEPGTKFEKRYTDPMLKDFNVWEEVKGYVHRFYKV